MAGIRLYFENWFGVGVAVECGPIKGPSEQLKEVYI